MIKEPRQWSQPIIFHLYANTENFVALDPMVIETSKNTYELDPEQRGCYFDVSNIQRELELYNMIVLLFHGRTSIILTIPTRCQPCPTVATIALPSVCSCPCLRTAGAQCRFICRPWASWV